MRFSADATPPMSFDPAQLRSRGCVSTHPRYRPEAANNWRTAEGARLPVCTLCAGACSHGPRVPSKATKPPRACSSRPTEQLRAPCEAPPVLARGLCPGARTNPLSTPPHVTKLLCAPFQAYRAATHPLRGPATSHAPLTRPRHQPRTPYEAARPAVPMIRGPTTTCVPIRGSTSPCACCLRLYKHLCVPVHAHGMFAGAPWLYGL